MWDGRRWTRTVAFTITNRERVGCTIRYTGLSFSAPERVRFHVKLDGHDADWQEAGDRRVASFYDLPPGDYVFRVRAALVLAIEED